MENLIAKDTLISSDESKQVARSNIPEPKPAKHLRTCNLSTVVMGLIFVGALVLFIWIIVSLFRSDSGIDVVLPFLDKAVTKELIF